MRGKMSVRTIGEVVGIIALVAGLVFVGLEIRQNNRLGRAAAYQAIGVSTAQAWTEMSTEPRLAELFLTARDEEEVLSWTREDWGIYSSAMQGWFRLAEMTQLQIEQGVLGSDAMQRLGYSTATNWLSGPAAACVWLRYGAMTTEAMRTLLRESEMDPENTCPLEVPIERVGVAGESEPPASP